MVETRFPSSRAMTTFLALFSLFLLIELLSVYAEGKDRRPRIRCRGGIEGVERIYQSCGESEVAGFSFTHRDVTLSFVTSLVPLLLVVGGAILSWIRPRWGYWAGGAGYALLATFYTGLWTLLRSPSSGCLFGLVVVTAVWLIYAGLQDEPPRSRATPIELGAGLFKPRQGP